MTVPERAHSGLCVFGPPCGPDCPDRPPQDELEPSRDVPGEIPGQTSLLDLLNDPA